MIPSAFDYVRAGTAAEAIAHLGEHGDDAKILAGGHSLLPLMKLRLASPAVLVDVARVPDLSYVRRDGEDVAVGALTPHRVLETDPLIASAAPLLRRVAGTIGDPQVRHRGTIGGSLAHADPASDLPAAMFALGATLVAEGPSGRRVIPVDEFFTGFLETALAPDELLVEVRVPAAEGLGFSFQKFTRRSQDWAIVGVAAVAGRGVGLVNMASAPVRAPAVEAALASGAPPEEAAAVADEGLDPPEDLNASASYRRHLARVLVRRALEDCARPPR